MATLTGRFWDGMHMTLRSHIRGLSAAARRGRDTTGDSRFDDALQFAKLAERSRVAGDLDKARWAAVHLATLVSEATRTHAIGLLTRP